MLLGKKGLSKREQEELRRKQDQVAAAAVYEEFVASFQESSKQGKTWVKGETVNSDKPGRADKGRLYKPTSKLAEIASTFQSTKSVKEEERPDKPGKAALKKKADDKKKSNLEMFKEELKRIQEEREERHRLKRVIRGQGDPGGGIAQFPEEERKTRFEPEIDLMPASQGLGMYDLTTDETSTNIYISSINPKMTEKQLMELFGRFGPLASVKIMWPRTDEEKSRGRNCGFVAFMNRKDGERALKHLKGREIGGFEMKLGWGKPVPIPPHPIYIPPALAELTQPPPPSGLPFNAQPKMSRRDGRGYNDMPMPKNRAEMEKTLTKAVVKVVIPTERNLLCVIHRMVEFVVREGPMFEAMIMNREINNPLFKFLFDNQSPAHVYYRWKLFSILNGDQPYKWRLEEFRMFRGGSYWKPPPMNPYTQGMPEELVDPGDLDIIPEVKEKEEIDQPQIKKGKLTDSQRDRLEDMLRDLTPERQKVGDAMVWCLDHADSAEEVVECITESLSILQTPIPKKIARLFLVSDILFNSSAKVPNASFFRKQFQRKLPEIFQDVHETYENIDGRLKAEQFKQKVMLCFRAWEDWAIYPNEYLINLQNIFLGLVPKESVDTKETPVKSSRSKHTKTSVPNQMNDLYRSYLEMLSVTSPKTEVKPDLDGIPLADPDVDGLPFEEPVAAKRGRDDDFDGAPLQEDLDGAPLGEATVSDLDGMPLEPSKPEPNLAKFTKSKWETVDETELEAQAMTTSKWDLLGEEDSKQEVEEDLDGQPIEEENLDGQEMSDDDYQDDKSQDSYGTPRQHHQPEMTEERRRKLREIEVKVMKYQDELEAGKRSRKPGMSMSQQIEHHRKKLLAKEYNDSPSRDARKRHRSNSPRYEEKHHYDDSPKRKRAKSPKRSRRSRSRSRSQHRRSRSRSSGRQRRKSKKNKHRD
ncbi:U2 snRNP-associated SURP motif-containing protein-like isoform X1 [Mercenaria mercenaria]|uniref:U2 snRNP-associated SURP motif-containing protein-like isoform X1 n=1 Tax=Mercenaria mercenaria TaxID=6596 RepID=UPI00234E9C65|nr:U2 snRNP-associated SURP motif-containing protein-like isoform X1 [Mercenaria mercenaria]